MAKRKRKKNTTPSRSPVPPPTVTFKDRKKEAKKKICRGQVDTEAD